MESIRRIVYDLKRPRQVTSRSATCAGLTLLFFVGGMNWFWLFVPAYFVGEGVKSLFAVTSCLAIGYLGWRSAMALSGLLFRWESRKKA